MRELVRRGVDVVGFDTAGVAVTPFPEADGVPFVQGDIRDDALLRGTLEQQSIVRVVHLAALVESADRDPAAAVEINALAAARLLTFAAQTGVRRVVAMSTKGVLGPLPARYLHPGYEPVPVELPPSPRTVYESTKYLVEVAVAWHRARNLDAAAVRLASTWGPGKSTASHGSFSVHSDVATRALRGESSRIDLHPDQGHDLVYYADVAAGLADLVLAARPLGSPVYHLGSGRITTVGAFAAAVEAEFPGVRVETGSEFAGGRSCLMDTSIAHRDAGYVPAWDVARGLAHFRELARVGIVS